MDKSVDEQFRDWEGHIFGLGYGSGEEHTLGALKAFLAAIPEGPYDYTALESALTPAVAWLLINTLCKADIIEYGTSPRYGWLTPKGKRLKAYVDAHTVDEMVDVVCDFDFQDYAHCYPNVCNCGPDGYEAGRLCANAFWGNAPLPVHENRPDPI